MSNITKEFLEELIETQEKLKNMYNLLDRSFASVTRWENENIEKSSLRYVYGDIQEVSVDKNDVCIETLENDDGYYHHHYYHCPLNKLLNDSWKEESLENYKKEKELKDAKIAKELEERERAEYERLKAKYQ